MTIFVIINNIGRTKLLRDLIQSNSKSINLVRNNFKIKQKLKIMKLDLEALFLKKKF